MHGHVLGELEELFVLGHEIGFGVDFDHHAQLAAHVDVSGDRPLARGPTGALLCRRQPLLAQELHRLGHIPVRGRQGLLAIHHSGPGLVPELFHQLCTDLCHHASPVVVCAFSSPAVSAAVSVMGRRMTSTTGPLAPSEITLRSPGFKSAAMLGLTSSSGALSESACMRSAHFCLPSRQASAMREVSRRMARMASSLPGIG